MDSVVVFCSWFQKRAYVLIALWIFTLSSNSYSDQRSARICMAQNHAIHQVARSILETVYQRAGYNTEFVPLPNNRSLLSANKGYCAAEAGRIIQAAAFNTQLRVVKPALLKIHSYAYSLQTPSMAITQWRDLSPYAVGHIRGELYVEQQLPLVKARLTTASYDQLFALLRRQRIDVAIGLSAPAEQAIASLPSSLKVQRSQILHEEPLYHFVHRSEPELGKKLAGIIKQMDDDGELEELYLQAIDELKQDWSEEKQATF